MQLKIERNIGTKAEVRSLVNHFLHKKSESMVISKDIALLEGAYILEDN
jgi:hypothetical protein